MKLMKLRKLLGVLFLSCALAADEDVCTSASGCEMSDLSDVEVQDMNVSMLQLQRRAGSEVEDNSSILLEMPSSGPTLTFYAYRIQNDQEYMPVNQNMANLAGSLWYLHNEIITQLEGGMHSPKCSRRFKKTRMQRFKVTYKPTQPMVQRGINFGVRSAYDFCKNTGDGCMNSAYGNANNGNHQYEKFGYIVGCQKLGEGGQCNFPTCPNDANAAGCTPGKEGAEGIPYPSAVWYSFPGYCSSKSCQQKKNNLGPRGGNQWCARHERGGYCDSPTGKGDCTYTVEKAGEISLDELSGITHNFKNFDAYCKAGCAEYAKAGYRRRRRGTNLNDNGGCGVTFFDKLADPARAQGRMNAVTEMFKKKFPDMPANLPDPTCDFDRHKFFSGWLNKAIR